MKIKTKFEAKDHADMQYKRRAAGPMKPKTDYNRHDKSWKREW